MSLRVSSIEKQAGVFVVFPEGSVDANTYHILEKKLDYLISEGAPKVITLDMNGVNYISSAGVRIIFKAKKNLTRDGGKFFMMNLQPPIRKVFEIINALPSLSIFRDIEELDSYLAEMQKREMKRDY